MEGIIGPGKRLVRQGLHPTILLNVAAPAVTYQLLAAHGVGTGAALLASAAFPTATVVGRAVRNRKIDPIGALSLGALLVGATGAFLFNSPHFLLVKDSAITGLLGLACLISLIVDRPLLLVLARSFAPGGRVAAVDTQALLQSPRAHARIRRMTLIWGIAFIAEAAARVALSFVLAPALVLAISPLLALAVFGSLGLWSWRSAASRLRAAQAA